MKSKGIDKGRREFLNRAGTALVGATLASGMERTYASTVASAGSTQASAINRAQTGGRHYRATAPATLDLAERAHLGIKHLMSITSEKDGYEMYWGVQKLELSHEVMEFIDRGDQ